MTDPENPAGEHDAAVDAFEQPLVHHLIELRRRVLYAIAAIFVLFMPLMYFSEALFLYIAGPLMGYLPEGATMIATEVASPFLTPFKLALYCALFLAMPVVLHQAWAFIAPGLYMHEKRFALPLLSSSIILFYLGIAFAYYIVSPLIFQFMTAVTPVGVTMMTDINRYLDFVLKLFLAFGVAFEVPIATLLLVLSRLTTVENLRKKRPYVVIGCFIVGMLMTPPDVISQVLLAVPTWMLFELGIVFGALIEHRRSVAGSQETTDDGSSGAANKAEDATETSHTG